jgi:hypothetical protein
VPNTVTPTIRAALIDQHTGEELGSLTYWDTPRGWAAGEEYWHGISQRAKAQGYTILDEEDEEEETEEEEEEEADEEAE